MKFRNNKNKIDITLYLNNPFICLFKGTFIYGGTLNSDGSYTKTGYPLTNVHGV